MENDSISKFPTLAVRLAAVWVAAGALFKLFAGSPNDLPPTVLELSLFDKDVTFRLAISIELLFLTTALLRPARAWPWICALYAVFLLVLSRQVQVLMKTESLGFTEAAFSSEASCGCFGSKISVAPGIMMVVDGLLLIAVLAGRPWRGKLGSFGPSWLPTGIGGLAIVVPWMVQSGVEQAEVTTSETGTSVVENVRFVEIPGEQWIGEFIYDIPFLQKFLGEALDTLPIDGTYVLYRELCDHCAEHIQELAAEDDGTRPFVFICIPEDDVTEENKAVRIFPMGGHVTHLRLPEGTEYTFTTPGDFVVEGGVVMSFREGIGRDHEEPGQSAGE